MKKALKYLLLLVPFSIFLVYGCYKTAPLTLSALPSYMWVGIGCTLFFLLNRFAKNNMSFIKVFTHELSHAIVAMIFNRKIVSFHVKEKDGVVWHSTGKQFFDPFISLAPYCLPYFTYLLLLIWSLVATKTVVDSGSLWALDIIIGFTLGLHICCFYEQTHRNQTDITSYPLYFSYWFIWAFRVFNLLIILLTFATVNDESGPLRIWGAFVYLAKCLFHLVASLF